MVLPEHDSQFDFSSDEAFKASMLNYIRTYFSTILGDDVKLLDLPNGLDLIAEKSQAMLAQSGIVLAANEIAA